LRSRIEWIYFKAEADDLVVGSLAERAEKKELNTLLGHQ